jgi:hypothetical protein
MAWTPYPAYTFPNPNQSGAAGQGQIGSAQNLQAIAQATTPYSSGAVTGLKALAGYMGGQAEANQSATVAQAGQASPGLLAQVLRGTIGTDGQAPAPESAQDDPTGLLSSTNPNAGWAQAGQGVGQVVGRKSDRRLKSDVTCIGALPNGLPVYRYCLEGGPFEIGLMADEVMALHPAAVWTDSTDGFLRVDYSRAVL